MPDCTKLNYQYSVADKPDRSMPFSAICELIGSAKTTLYYLAADPIQKPACGLRPSGMSHLEVIGTLSSLPRWREWLGGRKTIAALLKNTVEQIGANHHVPSSGAACAS